jgi:hypothetical protein
VGCTVRAWTSTCTGRGAHGYSRVLHGAGGRYAAAEYWVGTAGYQRVSLGSLACAAAAARPRAARAVLLCAGAYVSGAAGSNECPAGSVRIETEEACRTAAVAAGKTFSTVGSYAYSPRGCYYFTSSSNAFFNTHVVGAGSSSTQLLCAADTTGAPPHALCTPKRSPRPVLRCRAPPSPPVPLMRGCARAHVH